MIQDFDDLRRHQHASPLGTEENDVFTFIGTAAFTHQAGQLRYDVVDGWCNIFADIDGNGIADLQIVASGTQILAADFVL